MQVKENENDFVNWRGENLGRLRQAKLFHLFTHQLHVLGLSCE